MKLIQMLLLSSLLTSPAHATDLSITYLGKRVLQTWRPEDLKKLPTRRIQETFPGNSKKTSFEGPTLDQIITQTLNHHLTVEERALIDLVVLKEKSGKEIFIPRSFITKYPVVYDRGQVTPPTSTRPKASDENLPVKSYFLKEVFEMDLAYSKERFGKVYLKNRSDPGAVRGEKFFVQTCLGCHGSTHHQKVYESVLSQPNNVEKLQNHQNVVGFPQLNKKVIQSLASYLQAYAKENPTVTATH